eukprot:TRINITY_DN40965_c0_g1_i1.p1 TRINITY_DN40965_c0_g1~~TRINITY_DN40965_c0_g1_i1.p1  ORF type:complete len:491 (-),score=84.57 TRINITY_DN40965_c0_g1_i1:771-2243(-)
MAEQSSSQNGVDAHADDEEAVMDTTVCGDVSFVTMDGESADRIYCACVGKLFREDVALLRTAVQAEVASRCQLQEEVGHSQRELKEIRALFTTLSGQVSEVAAQRCAPTAQSDYVNGCNGAPVTLPGLVLRVNALEQELSNVRAAVEGNSSDTHNRGDAAVAAVKAASEGLSTVEALAGQQQRQIEELAVTVRAVREVVAANSEQCRSSLNLVSLEQCQGALSTRCKEMEEGLKALSHQVHQLQSLVRKPLPQLVQGSLSAASLQAATDAEQHVVYSAASSRGASPPGAKTIQPAPLPAGGTSGLKRVASPVLNLAAAGTVGNVARLAAPPPPQTASHRSLSPSQDAALGSGGGNTASPTMPLDSPPVVIAGGSMGLPWGGARHTLPSRAALGPMLRRCSPQGAMPHGTYTRATVGLPQTSQAYRTGGGGGPLVPQRITSASPLSQPQLRTSQVSPMASPRGRTSETTSHLRAPGCASPPTRPTPTVHRH